MKVVAYSVIQQLLDQIDSAHHDNPENALVLSTLIHYIHCCSDMPTTIIDLTSSILDQIFQYNQMLCLEVLPALIKSLYHCTSYPEMAQKVYSEIDYIFDKIDPLFQKQLDSIDFYVQDWKQQTYICTIYAEVNYFYFKSTFTSRLLDCRSSFFPLFDLHSIFEFTQSKTEPNRLSPSQIASLSRHPGVRSPSILQDTHRFSLER